MKRNIKNQAFSFVELIITITVLIILATIGFLAYQGFNASARDSTRIAQIDNIQKSLEMYRVEKTLPVPENSVKVEMNGSFLGYQGYLGQKGLLDIGYSKGGGKDPRDDIYFTYYVSESLDKFQILTYLEKGEISFLAKVYAGNVDYTKRIPKVYGNKLGILTDTNNTPIQEITSITASGKLDVATATGTYKAFISDVNVISGTGKSLVSVNPKGSCRRIKELGGQVITGINTINPTGTGTIDVYCDIEEDTYDLLKISVSSNMAFSSCKEHLEKYNSNLGRNGLYLLDTDGINVGNSPFATYCDMTIDGGGWTRYLNIKGNYIYQNALDCYNGIIINDNNIDCFSPIYANPSKLLLKTGGSNWIWNIVLGSETNDPSWTTWNSNRSYFDGMTSGTTNIIRLGKDYKSFSRGYGGIWGGSVRYMNYDSQRNFGLTPGNRETSVRKGEIYFR